MSLLTLMKSQPLAYNKDNQEDKEPCSTPSTPSPTPCASSPTWPAASRVRADNMQAALTQGFATATDLADYLVKKGLPFRDAHEAVGHAVKAPKPRASTCRN